MADEVEEIAQTRIHGERFCGSRGMKLIEIDKN